MSSIASTVNEFHVFPPSAETVRKATISGMAAYQALCKEADQDYAGYWARLAREHVLWKQPFSQSLDENLAPFYKWFADGKLNVSYNCLDKNVDAGLGDKVAISFEMGRQGDRTDRQAQGHSFRREPAKDTLGKNQRRLLRTLAKGEEIAKDVDVSTLKNPAILDQLKQAV